MDSKFARRILALEAGGFGLLVAFVWASELLDLPRRWLGAPATPVNLREALAATVLVAALATAEFAFTRRLLRRIKRLEGILPICSSCKKIRDAAGEWRAVESFVREHSEAEFSHGLCPGCLRRLYPDFADENPDR